VVEVAAWKGDRDIVRARLERREEVFLGLAARSRVKGERGRVDRGFLDITRWGEVWG
jgi:hypothetical protein